MKKSVIYLLTSLFLITSIFPQNTRGNNDNDNPCEDALLLQLKEKQLDELSDREYEYLLQKSTECANFKNTEKLIEPQQSYLGWYIAISVIGLIITLVLINQTPDYDPPETDPFF